MFLRALWFQSMGLFPAMCPIYPSVSGGSVILQWLNSGGLEQQDRGEPGGDLLTLTWLIASQGLSYANAFISKSTVII